MGEPTDQGDRAVPSRPAPDRVGGLPVGGWRPEETEPRVLGFPRRMFRRPPVDLRGVRHPASWVRWRLARRRRGPYVPGFDEWRRGR